MLLSVNMVVSLDGVVQGPAAADEDRSGGFTRGGWLVPHASPALDARDLPTRLMPMAEQALQCTGIGKLAPFSHVERGTGTQIRRVDEHPVAACGVDALRAGFGEAVDQAEAEAQRRLS